MWPGTCTLHGVCRSLAFTYLRSCIFASQPVGGDSCPSDTPRPGVRLPDLLLFPASWKVCPSPQNWPQHLSLIFNHPRGQGHLKTLNHTREELCVWEAGWDCWAIWFRLTALSGPGLFCTPPGCPRPGGPSCFPSGLLWVLGTPSGALCSLQARGQASGGAFSSLPPVCLASSPTWLSEALGPLSRWSHCCCADVVLSFSLYVTPDLSP